VFVPFARTLTGTGVPATVVTSPPGVDTAFAGMASSEPDEVVEDEGDELDEDDPDDDPPPPPPPPPAALAVPLNVSASEALVPPG
jgi:hypothetical protein